MREATVGYFLRGNDDKTEVLLGQRRSLFCNGIWNGPGGKFKNRNESIYGCLKRETREEIGIEMKTSQARHFATLDAYHPYQSGHRLEWRVYFLSVPNWDGKPRLTDAFENLQWFAIKDLPYEHMMPDTQSWIPLALDNKRQEKLLEVDVYYTDPDLTMVYKILSQFVDRPKGLPRRKL